MINNSNNNSTRVSLFDSVENEDLLKEAGGSSSAFISDTFWNSSIFNQEEVNNNTTNTTDIDDTSSQVKQEVKTSLDNNTEEDTTSSLETNKNTSQEEVSSWNLIVNKLIDDKIISEIPEDLEFDDSIDGLSKLIETDKNKYAKTYLESELAKLNPELKRIVDVELKGINSAELMQDYVDFKNVDTTDEDTVKEILKMYLVAQGEEEDQINIDGEYLSLSITPSLLEKQVNRAIKFLSDKQDIEINEKSKLLEERQKLEREKIELETQKQFEGFKQKVTSIKTLRGLTINQDEATQLFDYMTKPVKNGKTQAELSQTEEDWFLLEYIKMKGIDLGALARRANTEATKQTKKILTRQTLEDKGITVRKENSDAIANQDLSWLKGFKIT